MAYTRVNWENYPSTNTPRNATNLNKMDKGIYDLDIAYSGLLNFFYPVGTIYETTSSDLDTTTKMANHFGGTWEVYGAGRVLVGKSADTEFDTIGETGGAKTQALTVANLPAMGFTTGHFAYSDSLWTGINITHVLENGKGTSGINDEAGRANVNKGTWHKYTWGSGTAHNNLQPYIVVYRYRRVS